MRTLASKSEFDAAVKGAAGLVVVDFTAVWCGPCQAIKPKLEELATAMPDIQIFAVDVDENEEVAEEYEVSAMPTFLYFVDGARVASTTGADLDKIEAEIAKHKVELAKSSHVKSSEPIHAPEPPHATATGAAPPVPPPKPAGVGVSTSFQLWLKQLTCCS